MSLLSYGGKNAWRAYRPFGANSPDPCGRPNFSTELIADLATETRRGFEQVSEQFKEIKEQFKETDRRMRETDERMRQTDARIDKLVVALGEFISRSSL